MTFQILPPSAHATKASASKFLLSWLFQHEHEYRQWSAAISLGVISSCLHVTDHKQKFQNINALVEVQILTSIYIYKKLYKIILKDKMLLTTFLTHFLKGCKYEQKHSCKRGLWGCFRLFMSRSSYTYSSRIRLPFG